jgi:hypothetical protein
MNDHDPECECRLCRAPIKVENLVGENARLREALRGVMKMANGWCTIGGSAEDKAAVDHARRVLRRKP